MTKDSAYKKINIVNPGGQTIIASADINAAENRVILHGDGFPVLAHNSVMRLIGYLEDGIVEMEGIVTLSIDKQLNINIVKSGAQYDRREYLKVRTDAEGTVRKAFMGTRSRKGFLVNEKIRLRDISVGGICFFSNKVFLVNQRLYIDLHGIREGLTVKALVLRKKRESGFTGFRYRYGCRFIGLNNVDQRIICEYVFKTELDIHEKEVEKGLEG